MHFIKKLVTTLRILWWLGGARTFGHYVHSGWNGDFTYCRYEWKGREWIIPTSAVTSAPYRVRRWSFRSRRQAALLMICTERYDQGELAGVFVNFDSRRWIGL